MATTTSRLQLVIAGDNKSAIRSIQGTEKAVGGLQASLGGLASGIATGAIAAAGLTLGKQAVEAASNLYEQQTKVKTIFGESADEALRFGESADTAYGQSQRQALEAIGVFGNLFDAVGIGQRQSLEMSITLDELASDLASFNNAPVDDALTALRSGLVGEQEPLRRFGVNLNEATLKAKAMSLGLSDGKSVLTANAKAQAAYALILEQTTTAQGDFARTSDGLANQQRIAQAEWENTKATLGEGLLPIMKETVGALNVGLDLFGRLPGPVRTTTLAVAGLTVAVGVLGPLVSTTVGYLRALIPASGQAAVATGGLATAETLAAEAAAAEAAATAALSTALRAGGTAEAEFAAAATARATASRAAAAASEAEALASKGSATSLGGLAAAGGVAAAGVTVLAAAYMASQRQAQQAKADTDALIESMKNGADFSSVFAEKLAKNLSGEDGGFALRGTGDKFREQLDRIGIGAGELTDALAGSNKEFEALLAKVRERLDPGSAAILTYNLENLRDRGQDAISTQEKMTEVNRALGDRLDDTSDSTDGLSGATEDLRTETEKLNDAVAEAIAAQDKITSARESHTDAVADAVRADYELAEAQKAAVGDSDEYREAEERVTEALADVPEAQRRVTEAQQDLNDARADAAENLRDLAAAEREAALASADADLRVKEALNEQRRVNADPRATALERERAALEVAQAQEAARQARDDASQAAADNAEAQRKGIEGDAAVVAARQAVADADQGVADARKKVADAEEAARKVIEEARAALLEAQKKSTDAHLDEAKAWGDLVTQEYGAVAGAQAYRDKLKELAADLDPASPVRTRLQALIDDLNSAITAGSTRPGSAQPNGGQTGTIGNTDGIGKSADGGKGRPAEAGIVINSSPTIIVQGTPVQQQRALEQANKRSMDTAARSLR